MVPAEGSEKRRFRVEGASTRPVSASPHNMTRVGRRRPRTKSVASCLHAVAHRVPATGGMRSMDAFPRPCSRWANQTTSVGDSTFSRGITIDDDPDASSFDPQP